MGLRLKDVCQAQQRIAHPNRVYPCDEQTTGEVKKVGWWVEAKQAGKGLRGRGRGGEGLDSVRVPGVIGRRFDNGAQDKHRLNKPVSTEERRGWGAE